MTGARPFEPVVTLRVGQESYGIPVASVREVLRDRPLAPMPGAGELLAGVAEMGEERIPVLDLARRLGVGGAGRGGRLVVVRHPVVGPLALRVDAAAVGGVDPAEVEPVPHYFGVGAGGVRGIARGEEGMVVLLDVEGLLTVDEAEVVRDNLRVANG